MTVSLFVILLAVFSAVSSICSEGIKKLLDEGNIGYSSNILVFVVSCIVGIGGTAIYYTVDGIAFSLVNIICMILMGLASSMGAMVGYDKVIQTIKQIDNL